MRKQNAKTNFNNDCKNLARGGKILHFHGFQLIAFYRLYGAYFKNNVDKKWKNVQESGLLHFKES